MKKLSANLLLFVRSLVEREEGQDLVEYALVVALIAFGAIAAPNRIMMAPLTRGRGTRSHVPTPLMGEYYSQRASAGLIISEATGITQQGLGWPGAPGLWSDEQVTAWKPIVRAVHGAGGRIVAQLWHMGRLVHPDYLGGAHRCRRRQRLLLARLVPTKAPNLTRNHERSTFRR